MDGAAAAALEAVDSQAATAGLAVMIVWLHRRNLAHIGLVPRQILSACRIAVLLLLVLVLAGPFVMLTQDEEKKPVLALVVDESSSMTLLAKQPVSPLGPERMRQRIALPPMSRLSSSQMSPAAKMSGSITTARPA